MLIIIISSQIYNQLLRIEQLPGKNAVYAGFAARNMLATGLHPPIREHWLAQIKT